MKILIFTWRDIRNPAAGGAEVFTHQISSRLAAKGHEVTLFTSTFRGCKNEEILDDVRIIRAGGRYTVYLHARVYYKKYFKGKYDVVVDEINTVPFFTPTFVKNGEKIIALIFQLAREFWSHEMHFPINYLGYYVLEERWLKNYIDIPTITICSSTKQDLLKLGFKKIFIVPIGLTIKPLENIYRKEYDPTLIFVGRLKNAKKPQDAIEAFKIVRQKMPNTKLWVVGDGYMREKLERIACEGVTFYGHVSEDKKHELMSRAHVILVPSVREGWGLVVTEANALGTPAIGYDVPGLRDSIRDGVTGILTKNNSKALAEATTRFLNDGNLMKTLSEFALKDSKRYTWEKSTEQFMKVVEQVA